MNTRLELQSVWVDDYKANDISRVYWWYEQSIIATVTSQIIT